MEEGRRGAGVLREIFARDIAVESGRQRAWGAEDRVVTGRHWYVEYWILWPSGEMFRVQSEESARRVA